MTSTRHLIDDEVWEYLEQVRRKLGYKSMGKNGKDKFLMKLAAFADQPQNSNLFKA